MNDSLPIETDVAIVGGGMVGMTLALALSRLPLRVLLAEGQSPGALLADLPEVRSVADVQPRVSALTEASRRLLDQLGAWERLDAGRCCAYRAMRVWDAEGTGAIHFRADELGVPELGHILENRLLVQALARTLIEEERVRLLAPAQVTGYRHEADGEWLQLADGPAVRASLVVGADGALSRIRRWRGLATREWDYDQQAIVCTVETEQPHRATAWQRFTPTGPLAFLPLADPEGHQRFCSIVWSQDLEPAGELMQLHDDDFARALGEAFEWTLGGIRALSTRHAFPLRQRHARDYVAPGLALVGDAAHSIHPLAGQGVNLGLADAAVLTEELTRACGQGLSPGDLGPLRRYERRRKGDNLAMMAGMEAFKRLLGADALPLRWLRNAGLGWVDRQSMVKQWLAAEAMGLHRRPYRVGGERHR